TPPTVPSLLSLHDALPISVIVTAPDGLREQLRTLPVGKLLERCSRLRRSSAMSTDEVATRLVLRSLARRIEAATVEAAELERERSEEHTSELQSRRDLVCR